MSKSGRAREVGENIEQLLNAGALKEKEIKPSETTVHEESVSSYKCKKTKKQKITTTTTTTTTTFSRRMVGVSASQAILSCYSTFKIHNDKRTDAALSDAYLKWRRGWKVAFQLKSLLLQMQKVM